jgi:hypothetical protein
MTLDQIELMVRQANPVPDVSMLEHVDAPVLLDQHRRMDMETMDRTTAEERPSKPGRGLWLGVAAAIVIAVAGLVLLQRDDDPDEVVPSATTQPATTVVPATSATPVTTAAPADTIPLDSAEAAAAAETASSLFDALAANDAEAMAALLTPGALTETYGGMDELRIELDWNEAQGFKRIPGACQAQAAVQEGIVVRCPYDFHAIRSDELGLGPFTDNYIDFTVSEGSIVAVSEQAGFMTNGFSDLVWTPFSAWVIRHHSEDGPLMYEDWPRNTMQLISEESIPVWDRLTREYVNANRVGFVGFPPEGAVPSEPVSGQIVRTFEWCEDAPEADRTLRLCSAEVRVYDDGRVIWYFQGNIPEGANPSTTGWLEQQLTPAGIEFVRSLDAPSDPRDLALTLRDWMFWGAARWADPTIKPFVPTHYTVCVQPVPAPAAGGAALSSDVLPAQAANIENGWTWLENPDRTARQGLLTYCSDQPVEEARAFRDALTQVGAAPGEAETGAALEYRLADGTGNTTYIVFEPVL